jgi:hypothetical protein
MIVLNLRDVEVNPQLFVFASVFRVHNVRRTLTQLVISSQKMDPIHKNFLRLSDKFKECDNLDNLARPHLHQVDYDVNNTICYQAFSAKI